MDKSDLLKQIGFTDEFLKRLQDFEKNVIDLQVSDVSDEVVNQTGYDTNNLQIETSMTNSGQEIIFKTK